MKAFVWTVTFIVAFGGASWAQDRPTFDSLFTAFEAGVEPDLSSAEQRRQFQLFLAMTYGGSLSEISDRNFDIIQNFPGEVAKPSFARVRVVESKQQYLRTPELENLITSVRKQSGKFKAFFLKPIENSGEWLKIKHAGNRVFTEKLLAQVFDDELLGLLKHKDVEAILEAYAKRLSKLGSAIPEDIKSTLMTKLIHMAAFVGADSDDGLNHPDGLTALAAFESFLKARDTYAQIHSHKTFDHALTNLPNWQHSSLFTNSQYTTYAADLQRQIENMQTSIRNTQRVVRQLSVTESPFRSCLATDCATRTYFAKALDQNYIYFTTGDPVSHRWHGHVSLVLGEAQEGPNKVKVAMVDKVQEIPTYDLAVTFEAIRKSLAQSGYLLGIPEDLGDINGITNLETTRQAIAKLQTYRSVSRRLREFFPHSKTRNANLEIGHSRAEQKLTLVQVTELDLTDESYKSSLQLHFEMERPEIPRVRFATVQELLNSSYQLKNGSLSDQIRYIDIMEKLFAASLPQDPAFASVIDTWAKNKHVPLKLRFRVMTYLLLNAQHLQRNYWSAFSDVELTNLLQNWKQSRLAAYNDDSWYLLQRLSYESFGLALGLELNDESLKSNEELILANHLKDPLLKGDLENAMSKASALPSQVFLRATKLIALFVLFKHVEKDKSPSQKRLLTKQIIQTFSFLAIDFSYLDSEQKMDATVAVISEVMMDLLSRGDRTSFLKLVRGVTTKAKLMDLGKGSIVALSHASIGGGIFSVAGMGFASAINDTELSHFVGYLSTFGSFLSAIGLGSSLVLDKTLSDLDPDFVLRDAKRLNALLKRLRVHLRGMAENPQTPRMGVIQYIRAHCRGAFGMSVK
jgi:hypothetical protein